MHFFLNLGVVKFKHTAIRMKGNGTGMKRILVRWRIKMKNIHNSQSYNWYLSPTTRSHRRRYPPFQKMNKEEKSSAAYQKTRLVQV